MKKPFIYLLTAGLAVSMIANTGAVNAVEADRDDSTTTTVKFAPGVLSLGAVSGITFNGVAIEAGDSTAVSDGMTSAMVSDLRGTHAGWTLTAEIGDFSETNPTEGDPTEGNPVTLEGTSLNFKTGNVASNYGANVSSNVVLEAGGAPDILMDASVGNGIGESIATWETGNIELIVPQSVVTKGTHTATINWILDDGPRDPMVEEPEV